MPTYLDIRGVAAPTAQRIFAATADDQYDDGGALFESLDGGTSWVQRDVPFSLDDPLNGIQFLDSQYGWAFGDQNYRTTDGGTTWEELTPMNTVYRMEFFNSDFGYAWTGDHLQSLDGGLSWTVSPDSLFDYDFIDAQIGLGVTQSGIYRTTDGGNSFTRVFAGIAADVAFLSASNAVGIVDGGFVYSTDGGVTWNEGTSTDGRSKLVAVSDDVVLAWGRAGSHPDYDDRIFRSSDGGQSWTDLGEVMDPGLFGASFAFAVPDSQTIVGFDGVGGMFHSPDAGQTWNQVFESGHTQQSNFSTSKPVFADAFTGFFGYGDGFVIKTVDGGASWTQISSGTGQSLNDIDRFPNSDMIAVGDDGVLLTSIGGSSPWILTPKFTDYDIEAVDVVGAGEAVVVDELGNVFITQDGGATWTATPATPSGLAPAEDIDFTTLLDGWVIGQGFDPPGVIFHTADGGASWTSGTGGFGGAYVSMDVEGASIWASNITGLFYRSTDSGSTWIQGNLPGPCCQEILDMDFYDENIGYAVGEKQNSPYAARTDDGGATWQILPSPDDVTSFTHIHLLGPDELWVSSSGHFPGENSTAYHSSTGGQSWSALDLGSNHSDAYNSIVGVAGGDAWTVGHRGYIEHFTGPPPPPANQTPIASFEYVPSDLTLAFTDTSVDPDGEIVNWHWDFDDGETSTEQNPTHTFATPDTYWVVLTVTDNEGASDDVLQIIVVQHGPGGTWGDFTEVTPLDSLWVTPLEEDFWVVSTASADYDGDDDLDVAVLGFYVVYNESVEYMLVLMTNNGEASPEQWDFDYVDVPIGDLGIGDSDMAWGDVDGDGDLDLAVGSNDETLLFRNDEGTLAITGTILPGYTEDNSQGYFDLASLSWADYDNDGDEDLLIPSVFDFNEFEFRTALMRNDGPDGSGGWVFTEADSTFASVSHAQSLWADFDGDQDLDVLLVDVGYPPDDSTGSIIRYRNDGDGVFVGESVLGSLRIAHGEAQWGDYDADGDLDILVVGNLREIDGTYTTALRIYQNNADTFTFADVIHDCQCGFWWDVTAATWADYDSDGDVDILLSGHYNSGNFIEGRARIFHNDGGVFTSTSEEEDLPAPHASGDRGGGFSWLDIDNDGDLDYFVAGEYFVPGGNGLVQSQMHLYRNDVAGSNAAPTAPMGLAATVNPPVPPSEGSNVDLSWTAATDDSTPASALTYDLILRLNGEPVALPHRLPQPGSVSAVTDWVLMGLEDGEYTWTVRAVDSAFNGGPLAQGSFTVGATTATGPDAIPRVYSFENTYPNPFSGSTTIRYGLPESAEVEVAVYDILGRLVTQLVQDERPPGFHEMEWDASALASGTYLIRLSTDAFSKTRRAQVLR